MYRPCVFSSSRPLHILLTATILLFVVVGCVLEKLSVDRVQLDPFSASTNVSKSVGPLLK
jgi:hypothetical protein